MRVFTVILFTLLFSGGNFAAAQPPQGVVPGELLVEMRGNISPETLLQTYQKNGQSFKFEKLSPAFSIWRIKFDPAQSDASFLLNTLRENSLVENAQYNHYIHKRERIPNDTLFEAQWDMRNTGLLSQSLTGADIKAAQAWDITTGGTTAMGDTIVVAIIDGGFDLTHPDLNFWRNYNEIPGNGIDDDANGYIDDVEGWNAYTDSGRIEVDMHGTHVAGTVGARGNNTMGIAGVNWNVKILPIAGASEIESDVVQAYGYVYTMRKLYNETSGQRGAFIVATNSSFGVDRAKAEDFPLWCGMYEKMGQIGILSAVATANLNIDVDAEGDMPSRCTSDFTIVVTNTDFRDRRSKYAAYGKNYVDIGAPGTDIISTLPDSSYGALSGTSMATPHVAGAIALMYSAPCPELAWLARTRPGDAALYMKQLLLDWADPLPGFDTSTTSGGRLNVFTPLKTLMGTGCTIHVRRAIDLTRVFPNPAKNSVIVRYTKYENTDAQLLMYDMLGQEIFRLGTGVQPPGQYDIELNTTNAAPGMYFIYLRGKDIRSNILKVLLF